MTIVSIVDIDRTAIKLVMAPSAPEETQAGQVLYPQSSARTSFSAALSDALPRRNTTPPTMLHSNIVAYRSRDRGMALVADTPTTPKAEQEDEWRRDYQAMTSAMFFGDVPEFNEVLRVVREFEQRFNDG